MNNAFENPFTLAFLGTILVFCAPVYRHDLWILLYGCVHACAQARGQQQLSSSITLPYSLRQILNEPGTYQFI